MVMLQNGLNQAEEWGKGVRFLHSFFLTAELMSKKIRQSDGVKGVWLCGGEVKLGQFADDTGLRWYAFCRKRSAYYSNNLSEHLVIKKTKAMQLGRLFNSKDKPLGLKWMKCSTRFWGIYLSYDQKGNDYLKFTNCKQTLKY